MRLKTTVIAAAVIATACVPLAAGSAGATNQSLWCQTHSGVAILGDSLSTGYSTDGYTNPNNVYQHTQFGWSARMTDDYASWLGTKSWNYSHGGARVEDYLPGGQWPVTTGAVADIQKNQPSLVLIYLGINDQAAGIDPAAFVSHYETLVNNIRAVDSSAWVYVVREPEADYFTPGVPHNAWSLYDVVKVAVDRQTGFIDTDYVMPAIPGDTSGVYSSATGHPGNAGNLVEQGVIMGALAYICN